MRRAVRVGDGRGDVEFLLVGHAAILRRRPLDGVTPFGEPHRRDRRTAQRRGPAVEIVDVDLARRRGRSSHIPPQGAQGARRRGSRGREAARHPALDGIEGEFVDRLRVAPRQGFSASAQDLLRVEPGQAVEEGFGVGDEGGPCPRRAARAVAPDRAFAERDGAGRARRPESSARARRASAIDGGDIGVGKRPQQQPAAAGADRRQQPLRRMADDRGRGSAAAAPRSP